jgi:hypothetical protein
MNNKILKEMTETEFKEIYRNDKLLSNVAYAHGCANSQGVHLYFKAFGEYPIEYKVTPEQIETAKKQYSIRKAEIIANNKHNFLFVGMGIEYYNPLKNGIRNHRIRARFYNNAGNLCFIEFGKALDNTLRVDFSILNYTEIEQRSDKNRPQEVMNYGGIMNKQLYLPYTEENVLKLINETFGCSYKKVVVVDYIIRDNDYINGGA